MIKQRSFSRKSKKIVLTNHTGKEKTIKAYNGGAFANLVYAKINGRIRSSRIRMSEHSKYRYKTVVNKSTYYFNSRGIGRVTLHRLNTNATSRRYSKSNK